MADNVSSKDKLSSKVQEKILEKLSISDISPDLSRRNFLKLGGGSAILVGASESASGGQVTSDDEWYLSDTDADLILLRETTSPGNPASGKRQFFAKGDGVYERLSDGTESKIGPLSTLSWETASDWDSAVNEVGVAHESVANTDHQDSTAILMGHIYGSGTVFGSSPAPHHRWPFHEDSGSTAYDVDGGSNGTTSGSPSQGETGILNSTSYLLNTTNHIDVGRNAGGDHSSNNGVTYTAWIKRASDSVSKHQIASLELGSTTCQVRMGFESDDKVHMRALGGGGPDAYSTSTITADGNWHLAAAKLESNGNQACSADGESFNYGDNSDLSNNNANGYIGRDSGGNYFDGNIAEVTVWNDALTDGEIATLYDIATSESSLETATKSFPTARKPDLNNLSYSLNGQTIIVDVIGSPNGTSETVSQTLDGSTSYSLSWSNSHTNFRIKPRLSTTDPTTTPVFNRGGLIG